MSNIYKKANLTGGSFQDNQGNVLSLGTLTWKLSHDSNVSTLGGPNGLQVVAGIITTTPLDMNGNLLANQFIWTNDVLTPSGSYYLVRAYNVSGIEVWSAPQIFTLTYAATINVGTLQPSLP